MSILIALLFSQITGCEYSNTELGVLTCVHCEDNGSFFNAINHDIAVVENAREDALPISFSEPASFTCRRGHNNPVSVIETETYVWLVDIEFFSGESGSAVYDKDGNVCGIVLGNRLVKERWVGRVARLESFCRMLSSDGIAPLSVHPKVQRLIAASDSILESLKSSPSPSVPDPDTEPTAFLFPQRSERKIPTFRTLFPQPFRRLFSKF